ncbi:hypothetical protein GCM10011341_18110 [Frigidibacter albus]|nr:hypothetical protein GCM10011341_18110 [Frigidibacter albus]
MLQDCAAGAGDASGRGGWDRPKAAPVRRVGEQRRFQAVYGSASPPEILGADVGKRPPEGADGRCPAALKRLVPGKGKDERKATGIRPRPPCRLRRCVNRRMPGQARRAG